MALTDKLKAIADAIRGKTGGTDAMTLDEMAVAVGGIEVGGGASITGAIEIASGEFIPVSDVSSMNIAHGLSQAPNIACVSAMENVGDAQNLLSFAINMKGVSTGDLHESIDCATGNTGTTEYWDSNWGARGGISDMDETCIVFSQGGTQKYLKTGVTYKWFAIVIEQGWRA